MSRHKWVVVVALLASGCSGEGTSATDMHGRLVAPECGGGYDVEQSQVVLHNQDNKIIGTGTSTQNLLAPLPGPCAVDFTIRDVPDADFYTIEVGSHSGPAWSRADLESEKFRPQLALGDASLDTSTQSEFCAAMSDLDSLLADTNTLNNHPGQWDASVRSIKDVVEGFARSQMLAGDDGAGQQVGDYAAAHSGILEDSWYTIKDLNSAVDDLDALAPGLDAKYECASGWQDHGYH